MPGDRDLRTLEEVLRRMASAGEDGTVCVGHLLDAMGQRSFGPLLLVPSLIVVSPLSGIPGLSTVSGAIIALIAVQMLVGRHVVWLPRRLRGRCLDQRQLERAVGFLYPAARVADRLVRPRLSVFTHRPFSRLIAAVCIAMAALMPLLELVPFASSIVAAAIAAFALALIAHDGVLAIVASAVTAAGAYFGVGALL